MARGMPSLAALARMATARLAAVFNRPAQSPRGFKPRSSPPDQIRRYPHQHFPIINGLKEVGSFEPPILPVAAHAALDLIGHRCAHS
jgi:hypothetical protein